MGHCFITNFVIVIKMINKQQTILIDNNNPMIKNPKPFNMAKQRKAQLLEKQDMMVHKFYTRICKTSLLSQLLV